MGQSVKPHHPSRAEVASYAADMLASLRRLSEASGLTLLAHLVDLACVEAMRNAQEAEVANGRDPGRAGRRGPETRGN